MAEDRDDSQKTEEPTHRRLEDAHKRGEFASSREISNWFMLLGGALVLILLAPAMGRDLGRQLLAFLEKPHLIPLDIGSLSDLGAAVLGSTLMVLVLPLLILVVCAVAAGVVQHGFRLAPDHLMPKFERISPMGGAKRLFSHRSLVEFVKGLAKLAIVSVVVAVLMVPELDDMESMTTMAGEDMLHLIARLGAKLMIGVLAVVTLIAALDYLYQRIVFMRGMRMTRQEVKDELKQTEGDPQVRARLRQIRQERARRRMMAAVPDATAVITNPTHYAVALKYDFDAAMAAPIVVAKGADNVAFRIRAIAEENKVPVVESKALAQALYAGVEIGQEVPPEHYKAVAEIIGYVFRLQGKLKGEARRPATS
jgi:flagellar biosynthetic protein FlhB